jgi:alpha-L-fucosidase
LIDWHHPQFPVDMIHPQSNDQDFLEAEQDRDVSKYAEYLHAQVRELLTGYGDIDLIFFDFSYPGREGEGLLADGKGREDWNSEELVEMVRALQPGILINNRTDTPQDYWTPEQVQPEGWYEVDGKPVLWEACQTFSGSWGYHRDEKTWKSVPMLLRMLIDGVSKGGNLLLNVGPTARGTFDYRAQDRLAGMGEWMKYNERSIYGCTMSDFTAPTDTRYTQNFDTGRLYCHVFDWPMKTLRLPDMAGKIEYAQLLHDASEIQFDEAGDDVLLQMPIVKPPVEIPVVEMYLA